MPESHSVRALYRTWRLTFYWAGTVFPLNSSETGSQTPVFGLKWQHQFFLSLMPASHCLGTTWGSLVLLKHLSSVCITWLALKTADASSALGCAHFPKCYRDLFKRSLCINLTSSTSQPDLHSCELSHLYNLGYSLHTTTLVFPFYDFIFSTTISLNFYYPSFKTGFVSLSASHSLP